MKKKDPSEKLKKEQKSKTGQKPLVKKDIKKNIKKKPIKRIRGINQKIKKSEKKSMVDKSAKTSKIKKTKGKKEENREISLEEKSEEEEIINTDLDITKNKRTKPKIKPKNLKNINLLNKKKIKKDNSKPKKVKQNIRKKIDEEDKGKKKSKSKQKKKDENEKSKKPKKKQINLEEIQINDYKPDESILIHNHDIIEDCCLTCNEKNIFRAIKTKDIELFKKCLNAKDKISSLKFHLQLLGGLTPMEYIIKEKNKKLYTEFINFKPDDEARVSLPKDKLSFMSSGESNFYTFGFKTRSVGLSRGNKLGNNAFIYNPNDDDFSNGYEKAIHKILSYSKDQKTILFHEDEDFLNFINFAKKQDLDNYTINALLNENIDKGNISIVEYLMSVFTSKEIYNYNKLHQLVTVQKPGAEKALDIKNNTSTNKNNNLHVTPVHLACINPNEKILEELLKHGGETEFQDNMGRSPISYAATCKGPGPLKILIKKKCNVNDRENAGFTPLIHACRTGRYENVKLLLENGADPLLKPRPGQCLAIHFACVKDTENNLKILKLLLDKNPELINATGSGRKSPLHFAVLYNCPKIVEFLVKKGAKINKTDKYTRTPLLLSCKYGYCQITKYLIECGANFNKCDNSQNSPLHYACAFGNLECIKILLDSGADMNCLNMWRYLPIEIALLKNHMGIVNYLIQNDKFSVDTHFGNGNSFLLYYLIDIDDSTFEKIKYILEDKKGDGNITNCNKMNAFHFLANFTYRTYLSTFIPLTEKQKLNEEKHKKVYHPNYINILKKYINFLKNKGCDPDLQNIIGQTPLMLALKSKNFEIAQLLIEIFSKEINIKHIDKNGFNIFDYAFKDGYSLTEECAQFIYTLFKIYGKIIDSKFLNQYTRYGRNSILNLCEDYALHIYEKLYFINKTMALNYIRYEKSDNKYKITIPYHYLNEIEKNSYREFKLFITKTFYPLIEEFINRGCDINCHTEEKKFKNNIKEFQNYKYFNNYGKIYPIMYLLSYPESNELIDLVEKYKININCTDLENKTLLMYLSKVEEQIINISQDNYKKMFKYLMDNCNNIFDKNNEYKKLFLKEFEAGNRKKALEYIKEITNFDINEPIYNDRLTLFGNAVIESNEDEILFLLNHFKDLDINKLNIKEKRNPLHYVCMKNVSKREIGFSKFSKWIKLGVSITQKDYLGRNPLFYLFIKEDNKIKKEDPISTLSFLLDSYNQSKTKNDKFDLNDVDFFGNSLIFYAVEADAVFCVSTLLSKGVQIKNVKNYEKNSIFSYALLGNSNSIPELFSKVNDVKVFEEKIYYKNRVPIMNIESKKEEKPKAMIIEVKKEEEEEEEEYDNNINSDDEEELFISNDNYNKYSWNVKKEYDNNLETLFEENDEGTSFKILENDYNDDFNDLWENKSYPNRDYYIDSPCFPILNTNNLINKENEDKKNFNIFNKNSNDSYLNSSNSFLGDENDESFINESNTSFKPINNLSSSNENVYKFNYCNNINNLISNYINKKYGKNNYHYQNNYIPKIENNEKMRKFPKINSKKYNLDISKNYKSENDEEEKKEIKFKEMEDYDISVMCESLFKYCVDRDLENIIYYIINQGYDEFKAVCTSFSSEKYEFGLILLEKYALISPQKLLNKNSEGQTLIHILCNKENDKRNIDLIKKIYNILIEKIKIDINQFDKYMHTPLYYAVLNNNFTLIDLLTNYLSEDKYYLFLERDKKNDNNYSPLMLLYDKIVDKYLSDNDLNISLNILYKVIQKFKICYFNNVGKYLLDNYSSKKINFKTSSSFRLADVSKPEQNLNKIISIFNLIISNCPKDINKDIDEKGNNIFFLSALKNHFELFNDLLIKQKDINYNKINKEGKSLIHCIVSPHSSFSYQNTEFLTTAIKAGFNPNIKDKDGLTPLDYAKKNNYFDMIKILSPFSTKSQVNLKAEIKENNMDIEEDLKDNSINYNYIELSEKYYNKIIVPFIKKNFVDEDQSKSLVTKDCELIVSNYHVYKDDNNCLYNVNLSKVKINKYIYGEFLFYHMQLLVNDKRNMYNLITRWGRFGDDGQYQNTPFSDINEAIKEYNKVFLSKTGNKWDNIKLNRNEFQKKPKKYYLLDLSGKKPEIYNIINYFKSELKNIFNSLNPKQYKNNRKIMNPNSKELILYLVKIAFKQKIENRQNDEDEGKYNILYFSKESLIKGYKILSELAELNERSSDLKEERQNLKISEKNLEDENSPYNKNIKEFYQISQKILQLSNTYYEIIPFTDKRNYSLSPINSEKIIKNELDKLLSYTYIEDTLKLFLSSLYYIKTVDPIDYIYQALNKRIIPLNLDFNSKDNKDKKIAEILINYIKLTYNSGVISNIFEIIDKNENKFEYNNKKRILLFHGTKTQNMLGILSKGLLIAPFESQSTGSKFGNGIYLSDSFRKSLSYTSNENKKYVLMVDTFLDKVYKIDHKNSFKNVKDLRKKGYNCLINNSRRHISFENLIYLNNGVIVPTKLIEEDSNEIFNLFGYDYDSEYVIYDPKLVNIKYIIELKD